MSWEWYHTVRFIFRLTCIATNDASVPWDRITKKTETRIWVEFKHCDFTKLQQAGLVLVYLINKTSFGKSCKSATNLEVGYPHLWFELPVTPKQEGFQVQNVSTLWVVSRMMDANQKLSDFWTKKTYSLMSFKTYLCMSSVYSWHCLDTENNQWTRR